MNIINVIYLNILFLKIKWKLKLSKQNLNFIKRILHNETYYSTGYFLFNKYIESLSKFNDNCIEFIMYLLNTKDTKEWAKSIVIKYRTQIANNYNYVVVIGRISDFNKIDYVEIVKRKPGDDVSKYGRIN